MSPDRISPSSSMLELARALTAARGRRVDRGATGRTDASRSGSVPQAHDAKVLRARLVDLVGAIDPDDARAVAGVRRPLLQAIVLWELGNDFRQDPELSPMLDTLEGALDADARMAGRLVDLIRALRR